MKIGLYSITYRGVWYQGDAIDVFGLVRLARDMGFEGLELDAERPHAAPMDLSADDRKRLRDLAGETGIPICAVSPITTKPWSMKKLRPIVAPGWMSIAVQAREKWFTTRARK